MALPLAVMVKSVAKKAASAVLRRGAAKAAGHPRKNPSRRPYVLVAAVAATLGVLAIAVASMMGVSEEELRFPDFSEAIEVDETTSEFVGNYALEIYAAAGDENSIPWTILAALGQSTNHGRVSPYDADNYGMNLDRSNSVSSPAWSGASSPCMTDACVAVPDIGQAADQARGPMLIVPAEAIGFEGNYQSLVDSANYLAERAAGLVEELVSGDSAERYSGWQHDEATAIEMWTEVINRLPVAPDSGLFIDNCYAVDTTLPVDSLIATIWGCAVDRVGGINVYSAYDSDSGALTELSKTQSRTVAIEDALDLAWTWSGYGTTRPCVIDDHDHDHSHDLDETVDAEDQPELAGIFPLTYEQFAQWSPTGGADRCDAVANITAAALLYVDQHRFANAGDGHAALIGGIGAFGGALGPDGYYSAFLVDGPFNTWSAPEACIAEIVTWAAPLVGTALNSGVDLNGTYNIPDIGVEPTIPAPSQLRALGVYDLAAIAPASYAHCRGFSVDGWHRALAAAFTELGSDHDDAPGDVPPAEALRAEKARVLTATLAAALNASVIDTPVVNALWAVTPATQRISPVELYVGRPDVDLSNIRPTLDHGASLVRRALALGGVSYGSEITLGLGDDMSYGVAVAARTTDGYLIYPGGTANFAACGSPGNTAFRALPEVVSAFDRMCEDAASEGIELSVVSGTRTRAAQEACWSAKAAMGLDPARLCAQVGSSTHEFGMAVDICAEDCPEARIWLHSVVGCLAPELSLLSPFTGAVSADAYALAASTGASTVTSGAVTAPLCSDSEVPVKRGQTYGLMPLCTTPGSLSAGETWSSPAVVACKNRTVTGFTREPWHWGLGVVVDVGTPAVSAITATFPSDEWTNALTVAECASNMNPNATTYVADSIGYGLFALTDDGLLEAAYLALEGELPPSQAAAIEKAMDVQWATRAAGSLWAENWWSPWECAKANDVVGASGGSGSASSSGSEYSSMTASERGTVVALTPANTSTLDPREPFTAPFPTEATTTTTTPVVTEDVFGVGPDGLRYGPSWFEIAQTESTDPRAVPDVEIRGSEWSSENSTDALDYRDWVESEILPVTAAWATEVWDITYLHRFGRIDGNEYGYARDISGLMRAFSGSNGENVAKVLYVNPFEPVGFEPLAWELGGDLHQITVHELAHGCDHDIACSLGFDKEAAVEIMEELFSTLPVASKPAELIAELATHQNIGVPGGGYLERTLPEEVSKSLIDLLMEKIAATEGTPEYEEIAARYYETLDTKKNWDFVEAVHVCDLLDGVLMEIGADLPADRSCGGRRN